MRTSFGLAAIALVAALALSAQVLADDGGRPLSATMTGAAEVPGPGDPDGSGTAALRVNHGQGRVCYELEVADIMPARAAHIHRAPAGVAGPVVVPLVPPSAGSSEACADIDRDLAKALIQHPEEYYVNVHNMPHPGGAVRGQLSK